MEEKGFTLDTGIRGRLQNLRVHIIITEKKSFTLDTVTAVVDLAI